MLVVAPLGVACGLVPGGVLPNDLDACSWPGSGLNVGGEASSIDGPVTVVATATDDRISLIITPAADSLTHIAEFDLVGAEIDDLFGEVIAQVGVVFAGEGWEYGYIRLTDERGVYFEGGRSPSIDGDAQGGAAIAGPFMLGSDTGEKCRLGGDDGYDVALHGVLASMGDSSEPVLVDAEGTDAVWRGVDVRVVGLRAHRGVYEEPSSTADGLGPGRHDLSEVTGYLYRVP
jgi:hypothetical protein